MNSPLPSNAIMPLQGARESSMGHILLDMGKITIEDAEKVLRLQKESGLRFGEAAKQLGLITDSDIQQVLAQQFDYPYLSKQQGQFSEQLVAAYEPFSPQVEALRAVRSQLMLRWFSLGKKTLSIVSVNADEGSSLFVANLAIVFSQLGEDTLLVDANLRGPKQHELFNLSRGAGLSDMLVGRADASAIKKIDSFVDLSVLQAGTLPPNPLELVSKPVFGNLNQHLAGQYDVILYDVPAFTLGSDALAVSSFAQGALLAAKKNVTRVADLNNAAEQLRRCGVEVVGSVLLEE